MGDSKTTGAPWATQLINALTGMSNWTVVTEFPTRLAASGWNIGDLLAAIDAYLAANPVGPNILLMNIGVNDPTVGTSQVNFESRYGSVLDKIHAAWASTIIFVAKVWRGDNPTWETNCDAIDDTYIPNILSTRSSFARNAYDERVIIKASDNGTANTTDKVHYSTAGQLVISEAWRALVETTL